MGTDIVVTGSITLVHELIGADLVYSVVIGSGRRLFHEAQNTPPLTLR